MTDKLLTRKEIDTWLRITCGSPSFSFTLSLARTALALMDERDVITGYNSEAVREALEKIAKDAGDLGDGAPDAESLAHEMLDIESTAKEALFWLPKA